MVFVAVVTNFPATCTCQYILVLTVTNLPTFACDSGITIMQSWIELSEYIGIDSADRGVE